MSRPYVTIVSGLPRSGTSMMMRALEAGGMPVLVDEMRTADVDNPRGYYEFEPVKQTKTDPFWVAQAAGKAVKMVYRLLYDLPQGCEYRVLFMRRDLGEILASQNKMLQRLGTAPASASDDEQVAAMFRRDLQRFEQWLGQQANFRAVDVAYAEVLSDPRPQMQRVSDFLDGLDVAAMSAIVEPQLYRNRG